MTFVRNPKDFWAGFLFMAFGLGALLMARNYDMGTALRMGPAFFPTMLGALLTLIGVVSVVRSLLTQGVKVNRMALKEMALVVGASLLFGLLVRGAGIAISIVVLVMISGLASIKFKVAPFLGVAIGMAIFISLVFVKALGLQLPIFGSWFGY